LNEEMPELLVATDLDGTLLDAVTYSFEAALPALRLLAERRARLVLATSKTRAEILPLTGQLPLPTSLIVENGGALLVPEALLPGPLEGAVAQGGFWCLTLGAPRETILRELEAIAGEAGANLLPFSRLDADAIARLTGLSPEASELASRREYDEPFLLEGEESIRELSQSAERRGFRLSRGGRFWHFTGKTDKGRALRALLLALAAAGVQLRTIGLGDAANDLPLLQAVERPVVIPDRLGRIDPTLEAGLPFAERAPAPGPIGWNAAVLAILENRELARVSGSS
jgi:mannosyl-3-phosphoglycerate phosphatase